MNDSDSVSKKIMEMVMEGSRQAKLAPSPVSKNAHLYADFGYDSLGFVRLLLEIEAVFAIRFELYEMSACLWLDRLIAIVEEKVKERRYD